MGYRGKLAEREQARRLRAEGLTMPDIAARLGVSRSSVSLWTRDVDFVPAPRVGRLSEREFLVAGVALYAGEGSKTDHGVQFAEIDESRLRVGLHLHQGLDQAAATAYWSALTGIPESQSGKPYRAVPDASIRHAKHVHGCPSIRYSCSATHRSIMGLVAALLDGAAIPG